MDIFDVSFRKILILIWKQVSIVRRTNLWYCNSMMNKGCLCYTNVRDVTHIIRSCEKMSTKLNLPLRCNTLAKYVVKAIIKKNYPNSNFINKRKPEYIIKTDDFKYWWLMYPDYKFYMIPIIVGGALGYLPKCLNVYINKLGFMIRKLKYMRIKWNTMSQMVRLKYEKRF